MPRRLWSTDSLPLHIFERLRAELLIDPFEEVPVGKHHDDDQNGVADQADVDPALLREQSDEEWCEDRADPGSWDDPEIIDEPEALDVADHDQLAAEPGHIGDETSNDATEDELS